MSQRRHGAAAAALDGKIYVCGGYDGEQALLSVERYDPERRIWEFMPSLQQRRNVAFAVVVHKKLYVCSGCNGAETLKTMECFNPELNVWELVPPMEQKRHGAAAAAANGQLFVCGGGDSADTPGRLLDSAELYDPRKRDWTAATPMANIRIDMAAVSLLTPV
jgi:N-acetylneuraminic acid mutarotase